MYLPVTLIGTLGPVLITLVLVLPNSIKQVFCTKSVKSDFFLLFPSKHRATSIKDASLSVTGRLHFATPGIAFTDTQKT